MRYRLGAYDDVTVNSRDNDGEVVWVARCYGHMGIGFTREEALAALEHIVAWTWLTKTQPRPKIAPVPPIPTQAPIEAPASDAPRELPTVRARKPTKEGMMTDRGRMTGDDILAAVHEQAKDATGRNARFGMAVLVRGECDVQEDELHMTSVWGVWDEGSAVSVEDMLRLLRDAFPELREEHEAGAAEASPQPHGEGGSLGAGELRPGSTAAHS